MSRQAASKSRAEKGPSRVGAAGAQSVAAPSSNDVVPGRLTDVEWTRLMSDEDDTAFVGTVVEDIIDIALKGCYESYIWTQVLPYTVHQAKQDLLTIIEWQFLSRDFGEVDIANDSGWTEDSEPEPGIIDSWAQGSVPVVVRPQSSSSMPSVSMITEDQAFMQEPTATTVSDEQTDSTGKSAENEPVPGPKRQPSPPPKSPEVETTVSQDSALLVTKKKKPSYKKHTGRLLPPQYDLETPIDGAPAVPGGPIKDGKKKHKSDAHLSPSQKSLIKVQAGRPPGNREVTFDERGNVIGVMKLNAQTLPTHRVRVQYDVIDPDAEACAQRLVAMRSGKVPRIRRSFKAEPSILTKGSRSHPSKSITTVGRTLESSLSTSCKRHQAISVHHITADAARKGHTGITSRRLRRGQGGARIDPLPPSLIDTIEASPGVVIHEGAQSKSGPEEQYPAGLLRSSVYDKAARPNQTTLRMLGNVKVNQHLRPPVDPRDVIGEVNTSPKAVPLQGALPPVRPPMAARS